MKFIEAVYRINLTCVQLQTVSKILLEISDIKNKVLYYFGSFYFMENHN
jgi:hypothetical protein